MEKFRPKIHIIANCASRKRLPPVAEFCALQETNLEQLAKIWWENLNGVLPQSSSKKAALSNGITKIKARDLYIGSYWSIVRQLPEKAYLQGFEPNLWIISAGYGLISSDDSICSYSATFAQGNENSITNGSQDSAERAEVLRHWWSLISEYSLAGEAEPRKISQLLQTHSNDYFLIIASGDYLKAVEQDLTDGINYLVSPDNFLIITSKSFSNENLKKNLIPADARLQCQQGCLENCEKHLIRRGVRGSIGASLAEKIIEKITAEGFNSTKLKEFVENRIKESPNLFNFRRERLTDSGVRDFISEQLSKMPSASCTSLLRKLRDDGCACEGKRFKELYLEIKKTLQ